MNTTRNFKAVLWDFGGVILSSPFAAFEQYEAENGLPKDLIRTINSTNPDTNAWAQFERSDIDATGFCRAFEAEAHALGHVVNGETILGLLEGDVRPAMVDALRAVSGRYRTACLTNNMKRAPREPERQKELDKIFQLFEFVIESSVIGVRKPDPKFYQIACEKLAIEPEEAVYLDDLGINLKPARNMGMYTIKVADPAVALRELEQVLGHQLR